MVLIIYKYTYCNLISAAGGIRAVVAGFAFVVSVVEGVLATGVDLLLPPLSICTVEDVLVRELLLEDFLCFLSSFTATASHINGANREKFPS